MSSRWLCLGNADSRVLQLRQANRFLYSFYFNFTCNTLQLLFVFVFICFTLFCYFIAFLLVFFFCFLPKFQCGKFSFVVFAVFQQQQLVSLCTCRMFCELKPSETHRKGRTEHEHEYKHERRARERESLRERVRTSLLSCE